MSGRLVDSVQCRRDQFLRNIRKIAISRDAVPLWLLRGFATTPGGAWFPKRRGWHIVARVSSPGCSFRRIVSRAPFPEHRVRDIVFWHRFFFGIVFEAVWGARHRPIPLRRATGWLALTIFY